MRTGLLTLILLCPVALAEDDAAAKEMKAKADVLVKQMAGKDAEERLSAVRESATVHHPTLTSALVRLLKDKDERVRMEAAASLGLRENPKDRKAAAKGLVARLKPLEGDEKTREELLKIVRALHDVAQPSTIKLLLDMKADADPAVARARLMAVANIPSKEAIERLIRHGDKGRHRKRTDDAGWGQAMAYATQEKVKGGVEMWRKWWKENEATFDVELAAEQRLKQRTELKEKAEKREERKNRKGKKDKGGEKKDA